ncbi:MAG TPA: hypothetical protein VFF06_08475, partial [Polyangia bacterium]|nr:hypothetical protein [Polyangia bacterium]
MAADKAYRRLLLYAALPLAVAVFVLQLHPLSDPDTFWHLSLGRAIVAQKSRVLVEPLAFSAFTNACVCPEWLWEVLTFGVYALSGVKGLIVLLAAIGAAATLALGSLLARFRSGDRPGALIFVGTLVSMVTMSRMFVRPQLSYLILIPCFLILALRHFAAPTRWSALPLLGLQLLWAQLHGSFVLGLALFAVVLAVEWRDVKEARIRRVHLAVLLALLGVSLTNAYGARFLVYLVDHAGGDAVRHIDEMRPPSWAGLQPSAPFAAAYLALAALSLAGALFARKLWRLEAALALLGAALFATANRFIDVSAILLGPLAMRSAAALADLVPFKKAGSWVAIAASAFGLVWFADAAEVWWGPIGKVALAGAKLPIAAAAALRGGEPENVFSTYEANGALGFLLDGRGRVFVDGRTPLYFDDADYALARDAWFKPGALPIALARHAVGAVVAPRDSALCSELRKVWTPIVVEPAFTTFVPNGRKPALARLEPCGDAGYFAKDVCDDGGAAARDELARMETLAPSALWKLLRFELARRCGAAPADAEGELPTAAEAWEYRQQWNFAMAKVLLAKGRTAEALRLLRAQIAAGDVQSLYLIVGAVSDQSQLGELRKLFNGLSRSLDDDAPTQFRVYFAKLCMLQEDADCVRFQGMRAAIRGDRAASEALEWLVQHHPDERVKAD